MPQAEANNPQRLIEEAISFFQHIAKDCRAYTVEDLKYAVIVIDQFLHALATALKELVAREAHVFNQAMRELEAHDVSPSLLDLGK